MNAVMETTKADVSKSFQKSYMPDVEIRKYVKVLLTDEDVRGRPYRAEKKTGIDRHRFYWLLRTSPEFKKWYLNECQIALDARAGMVDEALFTATQQLDVAAMRTFYELQGRLSRSGNGTAQGNAPVQAVVFNVHLHPAVEEEEKKVIETHISDEKNENDELGRVISL